MQPTILISIYCCYSQELRDIAKLSNAANIGISESNLENSILSLEIHTDSYNSHFPVIETDMGEE